MWCDYVRRALETGEGQVAALFGDGAFVVSVDGRPVDGCDSAIPVTTGSRVLAHAADLAPSGPRDHPDCKADIVEAIQALVCIVKT